MRQVLAVLAVVAAGTGFAGVAHADADSYLAAMRNNHVVPGHVSESEAVSQGMQACRAMRSGQSARALAEQLANTTYDDATAANIVANAHDYLCPDAPVDFGHPGQCPLFRGC